MTKLAKISAYMVYNNTYNGSFLRGSILADRRSFNISQMHAIVQYMHDANMLIWQI